MRAIYLGLLCWWGVVLPSWSLELEILTLQTMRAEEIIAILEPVLPEGVAVSGYGHQLVVRGSESEQREVYRLVQRFDKPPNRFRITAAQQAHQNTLQQEHGVQGGVHLGHGVDMLLGSQALSIDAAYEHDFDQHHDLSRLLLQEGGEAFVRIGESTPVIRAVSSMSSEPSQEHEVDWVDGASAFYIKPCLTGGHVTLTLTPFQRRYDEGTLTSQHSHSTVFVPLGQWTEIQAIETNSRQDQRSWVSNRQEKKSLQTAVWVKVELLD